MDELAIRRAKKLLESGEVWVREISMWDGNTWHILLMDSETEEEIRLRNVTTKDAIPYINAMSEYANMVVSEGLYD